MITLIILIILICSGGYLKTKKRGWESEGNTIQAMFGLLLIAHVLFWGLRGYSYDLFVTKKDAFEKTLHVARKNGNEYEAAAIVAEVLELNIILAENKFYNRTLFLDQYIDDRIELLQPIE